MSVVHKTLTFGKDDKQPLVMRISDNGLEINEADQLYCNTFRLEDPSEIDTLIDSEITRAFALEEDALSQLKDRITLEVSSLNESGQFPKVFDLELALIDRTQVQVKIKTIVSVDLDNPNLVTHQNDWVLQFQYSF